MALGADAAAASGWQQTAAGPDAQQLSEKANQWEQIDEEEEASDDKPMSQWLLEKQVCSCVREIQAEQCGMLQVRWQSVCIFCS